MLDTLVKNGLIEEYISENIYRLVVLRFVLRGVELWLDIYFAFISTEVL